MIRLNLRERKRLEQYNFIHSIEELRPEMDPQFAHHFAPHLLGDFAIFARIFDQMRTADVRRHDDDGVLEIHRAAVTISKPPIVENLQKDVEYVVVRFFDFVEEHNTVGLAAD